MMDKLTDLELCKRIAEIEGVDDDINKALDIMQSNRRRHTMWAGTGGATNPYAEQKFIDVYNPLEDDALCFQLMIKYRVDIVHGDSLSTVRIYDDPEDNPIASIDFFHEGEKYNKPICLAIVEANNG